MPISIGPLDGVRVVDVTGIEGAYVGRLLSDLGASVVRVRHSVDGLDSWPEHVRLFMEAGKTEVAVELQSSAFHRRLGSADVLVTAGGPDRLRAVGIHPELTTADRPSLVHTNISAYGLTGPFADRPHSDLTRLAAGGLLYLAGDPDREPVRPFPEQSSMAASLHATVATLMAVRRADRTGAGDVVDVSVQEAVAHSVENAVQTLDLEGRTRTRVGAGPVEAGTGLFRCSDGWVYLVTSIGGKRLRWDELVEWMCADEAVGAAGLASDIWTDPDFVRSAEGVDAFRDVAETFMRDRTKRELYEEGQRRGISIAPVSSAADLLENPQLAAMEFFSTRVAADGASYEFPGAPYRFSGTSVGPRTADGVAS